MNSERPAHLEIAEYGYWVYGVLPSGEVTAVIHSQDRLIDSYIGEHTPYEETPLKEALEAYVNEKELKVDECIYWNEELDKEFYHSSATMKSALRGISILDTDYKSGFKNKVVNGNILLPVPVIFNRYGDAYAPEGRCGEVKHAFERYIEDQQ